MLGLLGGMSWESTATYYRLVNEGIQQRLGGLHSAELLLYSVDFDTIESLQHAGKWEQMGILLSDAACRLEHAGAEGLVLCTNTMHKLAPAIVSHTRLPLIHIADATAQKLVRDGRKKVGLLGTAFTMEEDFYRGRLTDRFGLEVIVPEAQQRQEIHRVIYEELCVGATQQASRDYYAGVIQELRDHGAEAVILGCTEIGLLLSQSDSVLPLYDTTVIHAEAAVSWMIDT